MNVHVTGSVRNFLRRAPCREGWRCCCATSFCAQSRAVPGPRIGVAMVPDPTNPGGPVAQHFFAERNGAFETKNGLTLHLSADLGSVRIIPLEAGAAPAVRYSVHIETDARAAVAQALLDKYVLRAKATSGGVDMEGALPSQSARGAAPGAQFWVQFEMAVPAGYNLEIKTDAGDIEAQDIGGTATLTTQGGNIRTGRIGIAGYSTQRTTSRTAVRRIRLRNCEQRAGTFKCRTWPATSAHLPAAVTSMSAMFPATPRCAAAAGTFARDKSADEPNWILTAEILPWGTPEVL